MAMRLDQYIVKHHDFTRNKAQQLILSDLILVNGKTCKKPSQPIWEGDIVIVLEDRRVHWVSRSAEKLEGFLESLSIPFDLKSTHCLDVGSSTGGFTQVLLGQWAEHVDAVDVGRDQLHDIIRSDSRVSSYEQTDIRDFAKTHSENRYDYIVCDASFISLSDIIDPILSLANTDTKIILLYKPQFEVGRENLRHTGIPKDLKIVEQKMKLFETLLIDKDIQILIQQKSTLMGEAGNQEWIYMIQKNPQK